MTAYEILMVFLGVLALLISFGGFIIMFLTFLDMRKSCRDKRKKK